MSELLTLGSAKCSKLAVDDGAFSMKVSFTTGSLPAGAEGLNKLLRLLNQDVSVNIEAAQLDLLEEKSEDAAASTAKTKPEEEKAPVVVITDAARRKEIEKTLSSTAIREGDRKSVV